MNTESYEIACKFLTESALEFVEEGKREFGKKLFEGGWFIIRIQTFPTLDILDMINSIPKTVFKTVGAAYNYDNLYFFPLFEELGIVFQRLQKLNHEDIEAVGVGGLIRTENEFMICDMIMIGDNRQGKAGTVQINSLELKWLSDPIFKIIKDNG